MGYLKWRLDELGWSEFTITALGRESTMFAKTAHSAVLTTAYQMFRAFDITAREVDGIYIVRVQSEYGVREYQFICSGVVYQARLL